MSDDLAKLLARPAVGALLRVLSAQGEEARIVGGAVRDALMARPVGDIDIATTTLPDETMRRVRAAGWKAVPTGLAHGTITVVVERVPYEVTTLRRDVETDGRHAVVAFSRDFAEDAARRDFTLNALSMGADGHVHDYATGMADAADGTIRFMGKASQRISEDYLRILRFFRFRASHGTTPPDEAAMQACAALKGGMEKLSRERIRAELLKLLAASGAVAAVREMESIALWPQILPGFDIEPAVLERLCALDVAATDPVLRLGALINISGRPELGAQLQDKLALSNAEHDKLASMAAQAQLFAGLVQAGADHQTATISPATLRRLVYMTGARGFAPALYLAHATHDVPAQATRAVEAQAAAVLAQPPRNPFTSGMVAALGVEAGPRMGRVLRAAEQLWLGAGLASDDSSVEDILARALATCD